MGITRLAELLSFSSVSPAAASAAAFGAFLPGGDCHQQRCGLALLSANCGHICSPFPEDVLAGWLGALPHCSGLCGSLSAFLSFCLLASAVSRREPNFVADSLQAVLRKVRRAFNLFLLICDPSLTTPYLPQSSEGVLRGKIHRKELIYRDNSLGWDIIPSSPGFLPTSLWRGACSHHFIGTCFGVNHKQAKCRKCKDGIALVFGKSAYM